MDRIIRVCREEAVRFSDVRVRCELTPEESKLGSAKLWRECRAFTLRGRTFHAIELVSKNLYCCWEPQTGEIGYLDFRDLRN